MSKNKQHPPTPAPRAAAPEAAPAPAAASSAFDAMPRYEHEFRKIGGNPEKNQIYKCQKCGYQTIGTASNAPPNPFTPACFVTPIAGPVKTP